MYIRMLHDESSGELTYLLAEIYAKEAVLIDPHGRDLGLLHALLAEHDLHLRWVLRTHHHDHIHPEESSQFAQLGAPLVPGDAQARTYRPDDGQSLPFGTETVRDQLGLGSSVSAAQIQGKAAEPTHILLMSNVAIRSI